MKSSTKFLSRQLWRFGGNVFENPARCTSDISVERKSAILADALASKADVFRGSSRVPVPLTTLVGLRIPQQVRNKHSEVLDARNLKRIVNNLRWKTSCLSSELLGKNKRKKNDNNFGRKKKLENPGIDPGTSRMLSERSTI